MNDFEPVSRPLELAPVVWLAMLMIGLLGLREAVQSSVQVRTLDYLESGGPVIVRSSGKVHQFPILGVEVEVFNGWSYLSVSEDVRASHPTFVHKESQSIVRLEPFRFRSWPVSEYEQESDLAGDLQVTWTELDHRWVARLRGPETDLAVFAITHQPGKGLSPEVRDFCSQIRILASN